LVPGPPVRVDTTNNNTDWTKKEQSHTSLVHDTGLANGHPSKRHATLSTGVPHGAVDWEEVRLAVEQAEVVHLLVAVHLKRNSFETGFETGFSLDRFKG
jgi:hypothetical protein